MVKLKNYFTQSISNNGYFSAMIFYMMSQKFNLNLRQSIDNNVKGIEKPKVA